MVHVSLCDAMSRGLAGHMLRNPPLASALFCLVPSPPTSKLVSFVHSLLTSAPAPVPKSVLRKAIDLTGICKLMRRHIHYNRMLDMCRDACVGCDTSLPAYDAAELLTNARSNATDYANRLPLVVTYPQPDAHVPMEADVTLLADEEVTLLTAVANYFHEQMTSSRDGPTFAIDWEWNLWRRLTRMLVVPSQQVRAYMHDRMSDLGCDSLLGSAGSLWDPQRGAVLGLHARQTNFLWVGRFDQVRVPLAHLNDTSGVFLAADDSDLRGTMFLKIVGSWKKRVVFFNTPVTHSNIPLPKNMDTDSFLAIMADMAFLAFHCQKLVLTSESSFSQVIAWLTPLAVDGHSSITYTPTGGNG